MRSPPEVSSSQLTQEQKPGDDPAKSNTSRRPSDKSCSTKSSSTTEILRRRSIRKTTGVRRVRRILRQYHEWRSEHMYLGRYSIEKMVAFEEYQRVTGRTRVFAVILLTPVPGLLLFVLLAMIPLKSPLLGVKENYWYFVQSWVAHTIMTFSLVLFVRCSLGLPQKIYSHGQSIIISALTAGSSELIMFGVALLWEFPIPLRGLVSFAPYLMLLLFWHAVVLGKRVSQQQTKMREYFQLFFAQCSILIIFQGIAIMFDHAPTWGQATIIVGMPIMRAVLKRVIWRFAYCLQDISTDVAVCVVEIFGSLFQNVCLQRARSPAVGALIVVVDCAQAVIESKFYLEHKFVADGRHAMRTGVKILEEALYPGVFNENKPRRLLKLHSGGASSSGLLRGNSITLPPPHLQKKSKQMAKRPSQSKRVSKIVVASDLLLDLGEIKPALGVRQLQNGPSSVMFPALSTENMPKRTIFIDDVEIPHRHHATVLSHTLQLMFSSEVLVFAEYAEFACSVLYGFYSVLIYHLPYAKYDMTFIGLSENQFQSSVVSTFVYAALEGMSMVLLFQLVRSKYGISTFHQLAFVLEKYWMTVQGKLVGSLSLMFILSAVHQGVLRLDISMLLVTTRTDEINCTDLCT